MDGGMVGDIEVADAEDPIFRIAAFGVERTPESLVIHVLNRGGAKLGPLFIDDVVRIPLRDRGMDEMDYFGRAASFIERELDGRQAEAGPRSLHEMVKIILGGWSKAEAGGMALVLPMWHLSEADIALVRQAPEAHLSAVLSALGGNGVQGSGACLDETHFGFTLEAVRYPLAGCLARDRQLTLATVIALADEANFVAPDWDHDGWAAMPLILRAEWQGPLPAELMGERDFKDLMDAEDLSEIECGWDRVQAAVAKLAPALSDPIVLDDAAEVAKSAGTAPLAFANGTEADFERLIHQVLVINALTQGPAPELGFASVTGAVFFNGLLGASFAELIKIEAGGENGIGQPYPAILAAGGGLLAPGLVEILDEILEWSQPQGKTILQYDGNRASQAVIGPTWRAYAPLARVPEGHESMDAIAGIALFLAERGWTPEEIAAAVGSH